MTDAEFCQLLMTQRDRLHTYAAWSIGDLELAMDVCQEAYTRLWQHRHSVHAVAGRAWLFKVAHRLCVDHHRQRAGRSEVPLEELAGADAVGCDRKDEVRRVVADGLARLSAPDRGLLVLRELMGMPIAEISAIREEPPGNVKVALHRARGRLRRVLSKVHGQDGL